MAPSNAPVSFDAVMAADGEDDAGERLFELANASHVRFLVPGGAGDSIVVRQDPSNQTTGGCVWETSYLLAQWAHRELSARMRESSVRILEVGAGCGLLGLSLAAAGARVLLTETAEAMSNLEHNVGQNPPRAARGGAVATATLHWGDAEHMAQAAARGPFDLLLGTDVVYHEALVAPLLETLWNCAGPSSRVWLCYQVRDPYAHAALVREAPRWFGEVEQRPLQGFSFADELECLLLELRVPIAGAAERQPCGGSQAKPSQVGGALASDGGAHGSTATGSKEKKEKRTKEALGRKKQRKRARRVDGVDAEAAAGGAAEVAAQPASDVSILPAHKRRGSPATHERVQDKCDRIR